MTASSTRRTHLGGSHNSVVYGGGLGAAAIWSAYTEEGGHKRDVFDFGISGLWGSGIGRYASSGLPDATVRANGEVVPILGADALLGLEIHPHRKLDIYFYSGVDYAYRTYFYSSPVKTTGYGSPLNNNSGCEVELAPTSPYTPVSGTCNADTRALWQVGGGFWYRFLQGSFGTMAWGLQYTYTSRNTWSGEPGAGGGPGLQPQALDPDGVHLVPVLPPVTRCCAAPRRVRGERTRKRSCGASQLLFRPRRRSLQIRREASGLRSPFWAGPLSGASGARVTRSLPMQRRLLVAAIYD